LGKVELLLALGTLNSVLAASLALGTYRAVGNIYRTSPPAKEMALLRAGAPMHFQETSIT
jgi:hypothetical protein